MKKFLGIVVILSAAIIIGGSMYYVPGYEVPTSNGSGVRPMAQSSTALKVPQNINTVKIAGRDIAVETVVMEDEMTKGLGGRDSIPQDKGMLFVFDNGLDFVQAPQFWMKDMKFSIDIIWIDRNLKVIYIKKNATPESYPQTFGPAKGVDARWVLEVSSGFSDKNNLKLGDIVTFLK